MEAIVNPHDKYFKELFSRKDEMIDFISNALPQIGKFIDFNTLQLDTNSYIDRKLKDNYSDLVYNCQYDNKIKIKIALLFEHKSYIPDQPYLQLLGYMLKIWETNVKQNEKLMPVIPILFYHGQDNLNKKKFEDYFENIDEFLKKYLPSFDYEQIDTSKLTDTEIQQMFQQVSLKTGMLLMKHIFDNPDKLLEELNTIFADIQKLLQTEIGKSFFETTIIYLLHASKVEPEKAKDKIYGISKKAGDIVETAAQKLLKQGKLFGYEEGVKNVATKMIKQGFDDKIICEMTDLSIMQINILRELINNEDDK